MKFKGIYVPVITPLKQDFTVCYDNFEKVLNYIHGFGLAGVVIGGTTGEFYAFSVEERIRQFEAAAATVKGKMALVAGINDMRPEVVEKLGISARKAGYDAVMLGAPPYILPGTEDLITYFNNVSRKIDLPVLLYNFPDRTGVMMDDRFLKGVSENPLICAIKESSGIKSRLTEIPQINPDLEISCGKDDYAVDFFEGGAASWICAASNIIPETTQKIYSLCVEQKDFASARKLAEDIAPLMDLLENSGDFQQLIKTGTEIRGLGTDIVHPPLYPKAGLKEKLLPYLEKYK